MNMPLQITPNEKNVIEIIDNIVVFKVFHNKYIQVKTIGYPPPSLPLLLLLLRI